MTAMGHASRLAAAFLGPLPQSDSGFMRRVRVHQAWYRATVLGIDRFGTIAGSEQPCGSVLAPEDANAMLNFHGTDSVEIYQARRVTGWGVDPVRCTRYMTSSQTLTFNMLGSASRRPNECADLFNQLLGRGDLSRLERAEFEFSPVGTPYWLGDRTLLDALLWFTTVNGGQQVVAVETKLADRFSTRRTDAMGGPIYRSLNRTRPIWRSLRSSLEDGRTRQLTRCHALAQSVQLHDGGDAGSAAALVVLVHPEDETAAEAGRLYRSRLKRRGDAAILGWDRFLRVSTETRAIDVVMCDVLSKRYVDLSGSGDVWRTLSSRLNQVELAVPRPLL
jgi:hypothetical protein